MLALEHPVYTFSAVSHCTLTVKNRTSDSIRSG